MSFLFRVFFQNCEYFLRAVESKKYVFFQNWLYRSIFFKEGDNREKYVLFRIVLRKVTIKKKILFIKDCFEEGDNKKIIFFFTIVLR